jgi:hypothetical protein
LINFYENSKEEEEEEEEGLNLLTGGERPRG